jgi:hypothetical protein
MKQQISYRQTEIVQMLFFFTGLTVASIIAFLFFNDFTGFGQTVLTAMVFLTGLFFYYYSTRFYKVLFDHDFIYFSRFRHAQKIGIEKVLSVKPGVLPLRFFYSNIYVVTIEYLNDASKKKIRFLSKGAAGPAGTINNIPFLDGLRQLINDKKYGG